MTRNGREKKGDTPLALALAAGRSVRDAAQEAGISERTVYRRLDDDRFRRRVREARAEMFDSALGLLADATTSAIQTLWQISSQGESETVRVRAAQAILDGVNKWREVNELSERLLQLESRLHTSEKG